jgi:small conductance mechanosensitive channel
MFMEKLDLQKHFQGLIDVVIKYLPDFAMALVVLLLGLWFIKRISKILRLSLEKAQLSKEITSFLTTLATITLKVLLLFSVAGMVGINTASFVAVLAAAGLAVGLALQGSLSNFAAGIIVLLFKPYKIGDLVEVKEKFGKVVDIQIFSTLLQTPGNKILILPNTEVINGVIVNYSKLGSVRLDIKTNLPYNENFPEFKAKLTKKISDVEGVLDTPPVSVGIESFESNHVVVSVRPFVKPQEYWDVYFRVTESIKTFFHENKIKVAYADGIEFGEVEA